MSTIRVTESQFASSLMIPNVIMTTGSVQPHGWPVSNISDIQEIQGLGWQPFMSFVDAQNANHFTDGGATYIGEIVSRFSLVMDSDENVLVAFHIPEPNIGSDGYTVTFDSSSLGSIGLNLYGNAEIFNKDGKIDQYQGGFKYAVFTNRSGQDTNILDKLKTINVPGDNVMIKQLGAF